MLFPVLDINVGNAANEKLEFALIEDVDQVGRDQLVEASDESIELLFDSLLDAPFRD